MSRSEPHQKPKTPQPDSCDSMIVTVDVKGSKPAKPLSPEVRERLKREVVDSYAVDREKIAKIKQAAIYLGRQKADLICEGLDLVLEKYREQLADLFTQQQPGDAPKSEKDPPSK